MSGERTLPLEAKAPVLRLDGFSLTIVEGPNAGAAVRAKASEVSIGTAPGNDLVITDPTVSRHHFSLAATSEGFLLKDLGSSNGTWVGNVRLQQGYVESGARIRVGRTTLRIDLVDEDIWEALSPDDRFGVVLG